MSGEEEKSVSIYAGIIKKSSKYLQNHEAVKNAGDLDDYLMLVNQERLELSVYASKSEIQFLKDKYNNLLNNIGSVGGKIEYIEDKNDTEGIILFILKIDGEVADKAEFNLESSNFSHIEEK